MRSNDPAWDDLPMSPEDRPASPTERAPWIVRATQTNQHNWIVLLVVGSAAVTLGVLGLIAGNVSGGLGVLVFGAVAAGPGAWWVRRATRVPASDLEPEQDPRSPDAP